MEDRTIDGNSSLKEQEITLNFAEKLGVLKLVSYASNGDGEPHLNLATFEDRDITEVLPSLTLTESPGGSDVWVSGVIKKVAATR
jgi:hypothetical protein